MMRGIKEKILSAFFLVISILVISGSFFVMMNFILIKNYEQIMQNLLSEYQIIEKTQLITESFRDIAINNSANFEEFDNLKIDLEDHLITVDSAIKGKDNFDIYFALRNIVSSLIFDANKGVNLSKNTDVAKLNEYLDSVILKNDFVKEKTSTLILAELKTLEEVQKDIYKTTRFIETSAASLFVVIILLSIFYVLRFSDRIIKPLQKLTKISKLVKDGNLNFEFNEKDFKEYKEISSLSSSFNSMLLSLKSNINKLNQYLDVSGIFVMTFDEKFNVIGVNKKALEILSFKSEKDVLGKNWIKEFVADEDINNTKTLINNFFKNNTSKDQIENTIINNNKERKHIVWRFRLLTDNKKKTIVAAGLDITELNKAKITINKLQELDNLKNEVLNIATHELKTPLISIVGLSEVIKNNPKKIGKEYLDFINIINSEGQKLNHLIKSMLSVNRTEMGKAVASISKIDLSDLKESLQTSLEMLTKRSNSKLEILDKSKVMSINSDKNRLSQIIYNFVDNAIKYGPEKQNIKVIIEKENNDNLRISVKDEGEGISELKQEKLFQKFSQLEPSLSRSQDGMGLGLYICKQNIEVLNGSIGVDSKKGKGSVFYVIVPINNK